MNSKIRLDKYIFAKNLSESLEKAKCEIIAGWVKINNETVRDPARLINGTENILVERPGGIYVSRGGLKLEKALNTFKIDLNDKIAADLGASTGGFTDCMLKRGAKKVYSIDVGYNQIDYKLRINPQVVVMEKTHVNQITSDMIPDKIDFITADLSFISILRVIENIKNVFAPVDGVFLIKPQFEAANIELKKGVVTDINSHNKILLNVLTNLQEKGVIINQLTYSPITGPKGNIEFLLYCTIYKIKNAELIKSTEDLDLLIQHSVNEAYQNFN